jgi:hypothetical protein
VTESIFRCGKLVNHIYLQFQIIFGLGAAWPRCRGHLSGVRHYGSCLISSVAQFSLLLNFCYFLFVYIN